MSEKKILDAIIYDAKKERDAILLEAEETAKANVQMAKDGAEKRAESILNKNASDCAETERRAMLAAKLEARKNSLAMRRELLEKVFADALERLVALPPKEYSELVTKLVVSASESGEEALTVPEAAAEYYKKPYYDGKTLLEILNDSLKAAGKKGELTLLKCSSTFKGGVRLSAENTDIDCSFEAAIAEFRDAGESAVSKLLFAEE